MVIFLADTWLHVTTKTVNFVQVSPVIANYSVSLLPGCTVGDNSYADQIGQPHGPCSLNVAGQAVFFANATQSLEVLNNASNLVSVLTYENNISPYTYLGIPSSNELSVRDYTATTFGMNTQCELISNACNLAAYS
jgi:hypothetical protein